jgi:hypothetical protein
MDSRELSMNRRTFLATAAAAVAAPPLTAAAKEIVGATPDRAQANGVRYIVDSANHRVRMVGARGRSLGSFGHLGLKEPGELNYPSSVAIDGAGRVHVAEMGNGRIQVFSAEGEPLAMYGVRGDGPGQLLWPRTIRFDDEGNAHVRDRDNIEVFDADGRHLRTAPEGASLPA